MQRERKPNTFDLLDFVRDHSTSFKVIGDWTWEPHIHSTAQRLYSFPEITWDNANSAATKTNTPTKYESTDLLHWIFENCIAFLSIASYLYIHIFSTCTKQFSQTEHWQSFQHRNFQTLRNWRELTFHMYVWFHIFSSWLHFNFSSSFVQFQKSSVKTLKVNK